MKRLGIITLLLAVASWSAAQEVLSCGFETLAESQAWTFESHSTGTNAWVIGSATARSGSKSLYVSYNGGTTCSYQVAKVSNLFAHQNVEFEQTGTYSYSYDVNAGGESGIDYLQVMLVPSGTALPTTTTLWTPPAGAIMLHTEAKITLTNGWESRQGTFNITVMGQYMLLLYWRNDADGGTTFSAAVDNIAITQGTSVPPQPTSHTVALAANNPQRGTTLGAGTYSHGATATIVAVPYFGYVFAGWSDSQRDNPRLIAVTADTSLTARFALFDTAYTTDTVHDTLFRNLYLHDTVVLRDTVHDTLSTTLYRTDTVTLHDTVRTTVYRTDTVKIINTIHDTLRQDYYHTDTLTLHDTTTIDYYHTDTIVLHDTVNIATTVHDTLRFVRTDTVYLDRTHYDTLIFTRYDTVLQTIVRYDTLIFTDTVTHFITDTVHDTLYLTVHDTIYLPDTTTLSLVAPTATRPAVSVVGNQLEIQNPENQSVVIYDLTGRIIGTYSGQVRFKVVLTSVGTYVVRIGNRYTHRVTVIP